jgi:hypothetical protein
MADRVDCELGRLPQHAAEHQDFAEQWLSWLEGGEAFLTAFRRTHGVVAEPIAQALESLQARRVQFSADQADKHRSVSDAITESLHGFRATEAGNQHRLAQPVQEL